MDVIIRDVRPDDAASIVGILNPIIRAGEYTALDTPVTIDFERVYILNFPPRGIFHVAIHQQESKVVGFQSMEPFANYTHAFDHVGVIGTYVDLNHRRQGVATQLFNAMFAAATRKGYEKVFTFHSFALTIPARWRPT